MAENKKKFLDIKTKGWEKTMINNIFKVVNSRYKYLITFETSDGITKWVYANDRITFEIYLKKIGATILKIEIQKEFPISD